MASKRAASERLEDEPPIDDPLIFPFEIAATDVTVGRSGIQIKRLCVYRDQNDAPVTYVAQGQKVCDYVGFVKLYHDKKLSWEPLLPILVRQSFVLKNMGLLHAVFLDYMEAFSRGIMSNRVSRERWTAICESVLSKEEMEYVSENFSVKSAQRTPPTCVKFDE